MSLLLLAAAAAAAISAPKPVNAPVATPTPYTERVVSFAALNKRTGATQQFAVKPGATVTFAGLTIRVRTCETTPEWEQKQTAAFLQIDDMQGKPPKSKRIYSGWMFAESPSLNPLEHPLYDVWVKSCAMSFPATGPDTIVASRGDPKASRAKKSPLPANAPSN